MSYEVAVKINHVGKTFHENQGSRSFKEAFVNIGRRITGKKEKRIHKGDYTALKDIDFEIKKGDFFGIVGRNGCGKSTLLKIIAGVYNPTRGSVQINGTLTPFIELGVGFNPELSGRDNVFLNGALLGFTRKQMEEMYDDIVEFAELKEFMDMKLKNYSSGMQVRLAFSVAIRSESDILLVDEVLAVGDAAFQQKCFTYFESLKENNKTVVFVTHDMNAVKRFCNKAIYIKESRLLKLGNPLDISDLYADENISKVKDEKINKPSSSEIFIDKIEKKNELIEFHIKYKTDYPDDLFIGISIIKDGLSVGEISTEKTLNKLNKNGHVAYSLDTEYFNGSTYGITAALFKKHNREIIALSGKEKRFVIPGYDISKGGSIKLENYWNIIE